ncbi:MAG: acyl carrier protein [Frankia sp.]
MSDTITADEIREALRTHLAEVLYCEPADIGDDDSFENLGMDSILGAEVTSVINNTYGLNEKMEAVYQNPTLNLLSSYVEKQAAGQRRGAA